MRARAIATRCDSPPERPSAPAGETREPHTIEAGERLLAHRAWGSALTPERRIRAPAERTVDHVGEDAKPRHQVVTLRDQPHLRTEPPEPGAVERAQFLAEEPHRTALWPDEAEQEAHERRLAAAVRPDQRDRLTLANDEREPVDHRTRTIPAQT